MQQKRLTTLPSTAPLEDFVRVVMTDGAVIISDFMTPEEIDAMNADALPQIAKKAPTFDMREAGTELSNMMALEEAKAYPEDMTPKNTTHLWGLLGRLPTHITTIMRKPLWQGLMSTFLSGTNVQRVGNELFTTKSSYILNVAGAFQIGPGAKAQTLHRDQGLHSVQVQDYGSMYTSLCGCLVAGLKATAKNGATAVIPGSHLWGINHEVDPADAIPAEMEKGSALFWLGTAFHGGGANTTVDGDEDRIRLLYGVFACRDYIRQEENQPLVTPREVAAQLPVDILKLAGWASAANGAGFAQDCDDPAILKLIAAGKSEQKAMAGVGSYERA